MSSDEEVGVLRSMPQGEHEPLIGFTGNGTRSKKAKCLKCIPCCIVVFVIVFVISIALAIPLSVLLSYNEVDTVFKYVVTNQVQLTKGSATTEQFTKPGAPIFMTFYMFNLTNMEAFITNGTTPHFEEIGPFIYRENKTKYNILWNEDETIMRYDQITSYTFDSSKWDPHTTNITTINLPLLGMLLQLEKIQDNEFLQLLPEAIKGIVDDLIKDLDEILRKEFKENLFMTRPVQEVIWGYRDELLGFLADSPLASFIPSIPKGGIFQLEEVTSTTGPNMIFTGKGDSKRTARFLMWNGKTAIEEWGTPFSRMINGTEALLFHPGVTTDDRLELFVSELFRSGYFTFHEKVKEYGIDMYQFRLPKEELDGRGQDPGFFMDNPPGMLNLSAVYPLNAPVYVSKPHFLDCDDQYLKNVSGLKPKEDLHDAFLNVEPLTGAVLHAAKRLQINVKLDKYTGLPELAGLPDVTYIPIMWVDEGGKLNSTIASDFKKKIYAPESIAQYGSISVTAVIGTVALVSLCVVIVLIAIQCEVKLKQRRNTHIQY